MIAFAQTYESALYCDVVLNLLCKVLQAGTNVTTSNVSDPKTSPMAWSIVLNIPKHADVLNFRSSNHLSGTFWIHADRS